MGEYAMDAAFRTYGLGRLETKIYSFDKVRCPVCEKYVGGKSGFPGDQGRLHGIHQHMRFKHGIKRKWERDEMLEVI